MERQTSHPRFWACTMLIGICVLLDCLGCAAHVNSVAAGQGVKITTPHVSADELLSAFNEYECFFVSTIESAVDRINNSGGDVAGRRAALRFQMHAVPACRELLHQNSSLRGIVDVWHLAARMVAHFQTDHHEKDDFADFAAHSGILLQASKTILARTEALAKTYLPQECYADSRAYVSALARSNPIEGGYSDLMLRTAKLREHKASTLALILDAPLAVFKISDEIDEGILAIEEFTSVIDRVRKDMKHMPDSVRWQTLLMLYDMERELNLPVLQDHLTTLTKNTDTLAAAAGTLDADARGIVDHVALRFGQLIGLIFALTLAYGLLSRRLPRPSTHVDASARRYHVTSSQERGTQCFTTQIEQ